MHQHCIAQNSKLRVLIYKNASVRKCKKVTICMNAYNIDTYFKYIYLF